MKRLFALAMIAVIALPMAACGDKKASSAGANKAAMDLLTYVPANTPYIIAATEPTPKAVTKKMEPLIAELRPVVGEMIANISTIMAEAEEGAEAAPQVERVGKAFASLMEKDASKRFGFDENAVGVFYGNGLLPVVRIMLAEPSKFGPAIDGLLAEMELTAEAKTAGGIDYKSVALGDAVNVIITEMDGAAVVTMAPLPFSEDSIAMLLGSKKPANALKASTLEAVVDKYGYLPQSFGYFDIAQIAATFVETPTGINADLMALAGDEKPELSAVCKSEIKSLAGIAPRLALGYTQLDAEAMSLKPVLELRSDIAKALIPVAGKVPGLTSDSEAMVKFGIGLNMGGMRQYIETYVSKVVDAPYECEQLAELNASAMQMTQALNQPVPPLVNNFQGFFLELNNMDGVDFAQPQVPENLDVNVLLAMDNVNGLMQFGQMMLPMLANIAIEPNGKAVELPAELTGPVGQAVFAAMTDNALGLSIGPDASKRAGNLASSSDVSSNTLIAVSMDMGAYADLMESLEDQMSGALDGVDDEDGPEAMAAAKRQMELSARLQRAYADVFEREVGNINITENGIEMPSQIIFR